MYVKEVDMVYEDREFWNEVEEVKRWWASARFRKLKRLERWRGKADVDRTRRKAWLPKGVR
jgi:hypothetical protein